MKFAILVFLVCGAQLALADAESLFIKTESGYELRGFKDHGFSNPLEYRRDYKRAGNDNLLVFESQKSGKKKILEILKNDKQKHILLTSNNSEMTSVILENDQFVSQVNCQKYGTKVDGCFLVTKHICQSMLDRSGKKNFNEFASQVQYCENLINYHKDTLKMTKLSNPHSKTYQEHQAYLDKHASQKGGLWNDLFSEKTILESGKTEMFSMDKRLISLINTCKEYSEGGMMTLIPDQAKTESPQSGTK